MKDHLDKSRKENPPEGALGRHRGETAGGEEEDGRAGLWGAGTPERS